MGLTSAVTQAVKDCINEGILADFLSTHSSEVINMLTTEWNQERAITVAREESRDEGREEGETVVIQIIKLFLQKKTIDEISTALDLPSLKVKEVLCESGLMEQSQ